MNWIKGLFTPLRKVEIRLANESLEWAWDKSKAVQERLYQTEQRPYHSPHCWQHDPPVPLHRTGLDTYKCLFCEAERQERYSGATAHISGPAPSAVYEQPDRQTDPQRRFVPSIRTQHSLNVPPHVQHKAEQ